MLPIQKITAPHILIGNGEILENKVLIIEESGLIKEIIDSAETGDSGVQKFDGFLMPGMINTHCHLELSHMKSKVDTGTGLVKFISSVVQFRDIDQQIINDAIDRADQEMWDNGIQAVGDICNKADTADRKSRSPIHYYSFVEMFDFMNPGMTPQVIDQYEAVFKEQSDGNGNKKSRVPHAPYSVSEDLFKYLKENTLQSETISIHNQETPSENEMFQDHSGKMLEFFSNIGMPIENIPVKGMNSIAYALPRMNPENKTILVHNTTCTKEDISYAQRWSPNVFWASCPNANLYIENRLPDYSLFVDENAKMTLGTDSLTSNWQLSIWEEIKTIKRFQSSVPFMDLITWACLNGAEALGYNKQMGSIEIGKTPGIVHVNVPYSGDKTDVSNSTAKRVI